MRKRKLHRRERKHRNKVIIISLIGLVFLLSCGYAAFQTSISLNAKGKIKEMTAAQYLKTLVTDSGDGLYEDVYDDNRYIYRGATPNNYITFNDETWRIISVESDNTIKIVRNENIGTMAFDTAGVRDSNSNGAGGTYCSNGTSGCNAWAINSNYTVGLYSGTVLIDATINTYLNGEYYNTLTSDAQSEITNHLWYIGPVKHPKVEDAVSIQNQIESEKSITWTGKIGLLSVSDYLIANSNTSCHNFGGYYENYESDNTCKDTVWLSNILSTQSWAMNPFSNTSASTNPTIHVMYISNSGWIGTWGADSTTTHTVSPVVYLSSEISLTGNGTENSPYKILNN